MFDNSTFVRPALGNALGKGGLKLHKYYKIIAHIA